MPGTARTSDYVPSSQFIETRYSCHSELAECLIRSIRAAFAEAAYFYLTLCCFPPLFCLWRSSTTCSPLCANQLSDMANKAGTASGYFVIHVTIRTATTIGLVSGSWNVRASFLLSRCLLPWTVMACSNRESVFTFPSDPSGDRAPP